MIVLKKRRKVIGNMQRSCGEDKQIFCYKRGITTHLHFRLILCRVSSGVEMSYV